MNWCRICRKEASSSSLVNNFGPTPDPATHLCAPHLEEWNNAPEHKRFLRAKPEGAAFVAFTDFIHRTQREGKIGERVLSPAEVAAKEAADKAASSPPAPPVRRVFELVAGETIPIAICGRADCRKKYAEHLGEACP